MENRQLNHIHRRIVEAIQMCPSNGSFESMRRNTKAEK